MALIDTLDLSMAYDPMPKIHRWSRPITVTEKIDGTNGAIMVHEDGSVQAASKSRWITPEQDNFGFARWVQENAEALAQHLGPGLHRGEWWGHGIQRGYGLPKGQRVFSLFNTTKWADLVGSALFMRSVPVLYKGEMSEDRILQALTRLRDEGSVAAPGFPRPEGIVIFHHHANICFKKTLEHDEVGKGEG